MSTKSIKRLVTLPFAAAGVWLAYSKLFIDHDAPLAEAIDSKRVLFRTNNNVNLNYYVDSSEEGVPLVLLHGTQIAATANDCVPLFENYRRQRPVFALELQGYGFSQRPNRQYTPQYMSEAILNFLESQVGEPADVLALGRSSEFVARAVTASPNQFSSLAFLSPTGLGDPIKNGEEAGLLKSFSEVLANPLWAQAVFDLITTRTLLQRSYQKKFVGHTPHDYLEYAYMTTHQEGGPHAPFAELRGDFQSIDVLNRTYKRLNLPVMAIYDSDPNLGYEFLPDLLNVRNNWRAVRIPASKGMPQFDRLLEVSQILDDFWRRN